MRDRHDQPLFSGSGLNELAGLVALVIGAASGIGEGTAFRGMEGFSAYSESNGGVTAMSRALAAEAASAVRVNTVAPGATASRAVRALADASGGMPPGKADTQMGRMAEPDEVAEEIACLLSPRALHHRPNAVRERRVVHALKRDQGWGSFSTLAALPARNLGHTSSLNGTSRISLKIRSRERPAAK